MGVLTSLARVDAARLGRAQPITTVRHVHVGRRPMVFVPLAMAGEANAPLAAMVGDDPDAPRLLVVAQPRDRVQRFAFEDSLALEVLRYIGGFAGSRETRPTRTGRKPRVLYTDAPQLWVPNPAGIEFVGLFGRSTRFRRSSGPHAVPVSVPRMGTWLTFFAEHAEYPGSSLLLAATDVLAGHWATGRSPVEDTDLAAVVGWVDPPPGMSGAAAAMAAEDPVTSAPAGPATDPSFDTEVLAPAVAEYDKTSDDPRARRRAAEKLETALRGRLEPTWHLMWRAIGLVRTLRPGTHVSQRWDEDRRRYSSFFDYLADGGHPQPKHDGAVAAAVLLNKLERHQAAYDAQRALDDPLVMAEHRLAGEAFVGTVTAADRNRRIGSGRSSALRPLITIDTEDQVRLSPGQANLRDGARPNQKAEIISVEATPTGARIVLELAGGMGRSRIPPPGSVPEVGSRVCYSTLSDGYRPHGEFPAPENTPWTHGGPPPATTPTQDDAGEERS